MGSGFLVIAHMRAKGYQLFRKYWTFEMNFFTKHLLYSFLLAPTVVKVLNLSGN